MRGVVREAGRWVQENTNAVLDLPSVDGDDPFWYVFPKVAWPPVGRPVNPPGAGQCHEYHLITNHANAVKFRCLAARSTCDSVELLPRQDMRRGVSPRLGDKERHISPNLVKYGLDNPWGSTSTAKERCTDPNRHQPAPVVLVAEAAAAEISLPSPCSEPEPQPQPQQPSLGERNKSPLDPPVIAANAPKKRISSEKHRPQRASDRTGDEKTEPAESAAHHRLQRLAGDMVGMEEQNNPCEGALGDRVRSLERELARAVEQADKEHHRRLEAQEGVVQLEAQLDAAVTLGMMQQERAEKLESIVMLSECNNSPSEQVVLEGQHQDPGDARDLEDAEEKMLQCAMECGGSSNWRGRLETRCMS